MRLSGRVALVTAAGSGMGRASARAFAREGAHVIVVDLRDEAANGTADLIEEAGGKATAITCDASDVGQLEDVYKRVEKEHGVLHVLFNHLGVPGGAGLELSEDQFKFAVDLNMKSAFFSSRFALPLLRKANGQGSIIFTASISGLVGSPNSPLYSMAKGGVVQFARSLALHVAKDGIRSNVICPGPIDTPMLPEFFGRPGTLGESGIDEELQGFISAAVPMGRAGQPEEIAAAALFLASDDSSFITGVALPVDGGFTAR